MNCLWDIQVKMSLITPCQKLFTWSVALQSPQGVLLAQSANSRNKQYPYVVLADGARRSESTTHYQYIPFACPAHSALSLSLGDGESIPYSSVSQFCPGHPNFSQEVDKGLIFLTRSDL